MIRDKLRVFSVWIGVAALVSIAATTAIVVQHTPNSITTISNKEEVGSTKDSKDNLIEKIKKSKWKINK